MSELPSTLPPRPSLEQLRKQAKDLLREHRAGDPFAADRFRAHSPQTTTPTLAAAQVVVAREHGFESWAKLVREIEAMTSLRLEPFHRQALDLVAAVRARDADSLARLGDIFGRTFTPQELRAYVAQRLDTIGEITLTDAQRLVARQYGFDTWAGFAASVALPPRHPRAAPLGLNTAPPFYRIDWKESRIEPRGPLSDGDWETIARVMEETGLTGLSAAGQMTDAALARVVAVPHLTRLDLGGSKLLTDDGLRHLAQAPRLQDLDLSGWHSAITDRGLEVLRELPDLRRFELCWAQHISDAGMAHLAACDRLESVNLLGTPTGDGAIAALAGKAALRRLGTGTRVTDAGLRHVHQIPVFRSWQGSEERYSLMSFQAEPNHLLVSGTFTDAGLAGLAGLDGLFGLSLFGDCPAMTANGLAGLAALPRLGFLGCDGALCGDAALAHIGALPHLRMLMAQGAVASDDGFAALGRSPTLEYVWGRDCPHLGGRGFRALTGLPALRGLAVGCKNVDDASLSTVAGAAALRELMPMDVSDEGFRHVGRCAQLDALWCMYCRDTGDAATAHLAGLTRLRSYYAGATQITDRSLDQLAGLATLEVISLWQTAAVTDAGVAALARLPRLRELNLDGLAQVTRHGAARLPATVRVSYLP